MKTEWKIFKKLNFRLNFTTSFQFLSFFTYRGLVNSNDIGYLSNKKAKPIISLFEQISF